MKAFLFVFDLTRFDREEVIQQIDRISEIENWYAFFGNTMCLASSKDSKRLSRVIQDALPGLKFIITEVDPGRKGGWLPKTLWTFLNEPRPASVASADA